MMLTTNAKARKTRQLRITNDDFILFFQSSAKFQSVLSLKMCLSIDNKPFIEGLD